VENGRLEVTPRLADAIAERTGFDLMSLTYLWGLRENNGDLYEKLLRKKWKVVLEEERRLEEYTREQFDSARSPEGGRNLSADQFIEAIRPHLLGAHQVAQFGRDGTGRLKRAVLRALMQTTSAIWNETMDALPDDLPEEK